MDRLALDHQPPAQMDQASQHAHEHRQQQDEDRIGDQHHAEQTRAYYFPNQYSYVLFQCLSSRGQCVIGWRGQSKASGNDPERFFYIGPYDSEDFFDTQGQVREPREVSARLALRQYETIKGAQQHRELLLTARTSGAPALGVVSLREADKYHHFRDTLKNLLSLSTITQDQMRDRLLMLAEISAEAVALDARQLFGDDYDLIRRRRDALLRFKKHAEAVAILVQRFAQREMVRGELLFRWTELRTKKQQFERDYEDKRQRLLGDIATEAERGERLRGECQAARQDESGLREQRGAINRDLEKLHALATEFADFIEELEREGLRVLEDDLAKLRRQLDDAQGENPITVERNLAGAKSMVLQKEASLQNFDRLLITQLRKRFTDPELDQIFTLLNFELLEYPVGPDGIVLRDADALEASLRRCLERIRTDVYEDGFVTATLRPGHRQVSELEDVDRVREELEEWRKRLDRLTATLNAMRQREQVQTLLKQKQAEREAKARRLFAFEQYQAEKLKEPQLRADLKAFDQSLSALGTKIEKLEAQITESQSRHNSLKGSVTKADDRFNAIMGRFGLCLFPQFETEAHLVAELPADFDMAIDVFVRQQDEERLLSAEISHLLRELERNLGEEYVGVQERETVARLEQELEAMAEREDALARDWNAHLHGLRSTFDQVLKELGEVRSAADQLNRQFKTFQVSNLKSIKLEAIPHPDHVTWIKRLAEMHQPSLFDEDQDLEGTLKNFRQKLQSNPIIRYTDLFTLRFTVTGEDDVPHHYQDFKQIESHSTTITVKVLFNLLVLKSLLRKDDCLVPFFLDEIQALDEANRRAILTTAKRLGFIAITAAPDAVGEVDAVYYLQPRKGRVTLQANHRYRLIPKLAEP